MDFKSFNTEESSAEGTWMTVKDHLENPLDAMIKVLGPDSKEAAAIDIEAERENSRKLGDMFASRAAAAKKPEAPLPVDKEATERVERDVARAIRLTKDWKNISWGKDELKFDKANATMLYTKVPMIREQVLEYYKYRSNFIAPEPKS